MNRPRAWTKFDVRRALLATKAAREGADHAGIAAAAGIRRSTLQSWLAKGRKGEPGYAELVDALDQAAEDHENYEFGLELIARVAGPAGVSFVRTIRPQMMTSGDRPLPLRCPGCGRFRRGRGQPSAIAVPNPTTLPSG